MRLMNMKSLLKALAVAMALAASAACGAAPVADTARNRGDNPEIEADPLNDSPALALPKGRPAKDYPMTDPPRFHVCTDVVRSM